MKRWRVYLLVSVLAVAACETVTQPLPDGAQRFVPGVPYRLWWSMVESCSGLQGNFDAVSWYEVPDADSILADGEWVGGYWAARGNRIVIAGKERYDGPLIRHEVLHALTRAGHTRTFFVDRCGGWVDCVSDCAREAGVPAVPDSSAIVVPARDLSLMVDLIGADTASIRRDSGWIAISVAIRNDRDVDVWALLDGIPGDGDAFAETFGYSLIDSRANCTGSGDVTTNYIEGVRFGIPAHATRRLVFDRRLYQSSYCVLGFFNSDTSQAIPVSYTY